MQSRQIVERVWMMAGPIVSGQGLLLWDVTFEKEGADYVLTVFIDRAEGVVSIEDCETVSRPLDRALDEEDFIDCSYTLSVSSAGLTRTLRRPEHYAYAMGRQVELRSFAPVDGRKEWTGRLVDYQDGAVSVETEGGAQVTLPKEAVALCRIAFEW